MNDPSQHPFDSPIPEPSSPADLAADALLDRAVAALAEDLPAPALVEAAGARAWANLADAGALAAGRSTGTDYRVLIPDYLAGRLSPAQALLVADHIRENPAFRAEVEAARTGVAARPLTGVAPAALADAAGRGGIPRLGARRAFALAMAASVVLALGTFLFARDRIQPGRALAQVTAVEGGLVAVGDPAGDSGAARRLAAGDPIRPRQTLRALGDQGAVVTLADGSRIEMGPRAELSLASRWNGLAVNLERGDIVVRAAEQGRGRLSVATEDLDIAVQGTIFAVRSGTKGDRVSVLEGSVQVRGNQGRASLSPGMQYVSHERVARVPVAADIAWSRDRAEYLAILDALGTLGEEIDDSVARPEARTASALLDAVPADSAVYLALPNLGRTYADAYGRFKDGVQADPVLRDWWAKSNPDAETQARMDTIIAALGRLGDQVGDEIVVAAGVEPDGAMEVPVILAELADPSAFRGAIETELAGLHAALEGDDARGADPEAMPITFLEDEAALDRALASEGPAPTDPAADAVPGPATGANSVDPETLYVWLGPGPMVVSPRAEGIAGVVRGPHGLPEDFRAAVLAAYRDGIDALLAVDVARLSTLVREEMEADADAAGRDAATEEAFELSGLDDARFAVITQVSRDGRSQIEADLSLESREEGVASWLAAPGPMGALDFVSPDAYLAGAALIDRPERVVAEFLGLARANDPEFTEDPDLADGAELLENLAQALGSEVAFAVDGPLLPRPGWKLVVEVSDPAALQAALEEMVAQVNERLEGQRRLVLSQAELNGRPLWTLAVTAGDASRPGDAGAADAAGAAVTSGEGLEAIHWLYADGYWLAGSEPALLANALRTRESGVTLRSSEAFVASMPEGAETDFSALLWQDFGRLARMLEEASEAAGGMAGMGEEELSAMSGLAGQLAPALIYAWAEPERLRFAGSSETNPLGMGLLLQLLGGSAIDGAGPGSPGGMPGDFPLPAPGLRDAVWAPST